MDTHRTRKDLRKLNVLPNKRRGQNFVVQDSLIDEIIKFAGDFTDKYVLEIGPGLGALTDKLYICKGLTVIEVEQKFCEDLKRKYPEIKIVQNDFRNVDITELAVDETEKVEESKKVYTVFSNVPYVYSTDMIFYLIKNRSVLETCTLLLQREFAERLASEPGSRAYGVISLMVQNWCEMKLGKIFPGTYFYPVTKVESRIIQLRFRDTPRVKEEDFPAFQRVVKAAFSQRRKKIHNAIKNSGFFVDKDIDGSLLKANIDPSRRPETVSIEEFCTLSKILETNFKPTTE